MKRPARATSIELIRFVAAAAVMLFHFSSIYVGNDKVVPFAYIFVEFFFLLSGFFMMKHLSEKNNPMNPAAYVLHKAASFYPLYVVAFAIQFILFVQMNHLGSAQEVAGGLFHFKWEALLLQTAGFIQNPQFNSDYLMGQAWYLSAMLIALLISYPLARHFKKAYISVVCPLVIIIVYAYVMQTLGTLNIGNEYFGFIMSAILRALAGTCVGSLCYVAYSKLKDKPIGKNKAVIVLEAACYLSLIGLFLLKDFMADGDILFFLLIFGALIIFAFLGQTPISAFLNTHGTRLLTYLGSLSLYVYLLHWSVMSAMQLWLPDIAPVPATLLFFAITIAISACLKWLNDKRKSIKPVIVVVAVLLCIAFTVPYWGIS